VEFGCIEALLSLPECRVIHQVISPKQLEFHLERRDPFIVCPRCQTCCSRVQERRPRCIRDLPLLARIIHQPKKSTREGPFGGQRILHTTVFQDHHDPKASSSAALGSVRIGRSVVIRRTSSEPPPWADNHRFTLEPPEIVRALTGPAASGVHTLTTLHSASIPAPPDRTRATPS
jgi:hypothetical protein